jgi:hypothetical protein
MTKRFTARSLAIYLGTLCPIALLLGMMVVSIDRAARIPLRDSRADVAAYVLGLLATGAIGHIFATIVLPAGTFKSVGESRLGLSGCLRHRVLTCNSHGL